MATGANKEAADLVQQVFDSYNNRDMFNVTRTFLNFETNEERTTFCCDILESKGLLPDLRMDIKNNAIGEVYRQKGNEMFKKKDARKAHEFYTRSIASCVKGSSAMALAYANRSAVSFENGLYEECITDIDSVFANDYPESIKQKVLIRQSKAKELLPTQVKVAFNTPIPTIPKEHQNNLVQSAFDSIEIKQSKEFGRFIVAKRDIQPGEIIAIESPFCKAIYEEVYNHCFHCLTLCYNLQPCPTCTVAMFCSERCQNEAFESYHQYECPILKTIDELGYFKLITHLRIALVGRRYFENLDQCVLEKEGMYRSDRFNEIYNLMANTSERSVSDLMGISLKATILYTLVKNFTKLFDGKSEKFKDDFRHVILHTLQIGQCNFHEIYEYKSQNQMDPDVLGMGAYSLLSLFNHSCIPNVSRTCYGPVIVVYAIETIKSGEQCFDNYGYHHALTSKIERGGALRANYFFECACPACKNNYPLYHEMSTEETQLTEQEVNQLTQGDLETAQLMYPKLLSKIAACCARKPNKALGELQEAQKKCCFIRSTVNTPI